MRWLTTFIIVVTSGVVIAQQSDTLAEEAEDARLSTFLEYARKAGISDTLATGGPFTIFAPTNKAFNSLRPSFKTRLETDRQLLRKLLFLHFIPGHVLTSSLRNRRVISSMIGAPLTFKVGDGGVTVNHVRLLSSNITASNGVIHIIGEVLLPESVSTLIDVADEMEDLSMFSTLIKQGNLEDTLSDGGAFTMFAPTNAAFMSLSQEFIFKIKSDPQLLRSLVLYHITPGKVMSRDVTNGRTVTSIEGRNLRFKVNRRKNITVNDVTVMKVDLNATNGVLHLIDQVLIPPTLQEYAKDNLFQVAEKGGFTIMAELLKQAGLYDTVAYGGPYTLLAPSDSVLTQVDDSLLLQLQVNPDILELVLLHHIIPGATYSSDIYDGLTKVTLGGETLNFTVAQSQINVNEGIFVDSNVLASNGVLHSIDTLLVPSGNQPLRQVNRNLEEEAKNQGLSIFLDLIKKADIRLLSTPGPYTIFAPTNKAFASLSASTLQKITNDKELLRNVLLYHIVSGRVGSLNLGNDLLASSIKGDLLRVNLYNEGTLDEILTVNGGKVTEQDILASNGVIHVLDKVVLPPAGDISKILARDPRLSTLNTAVIAAGMMDVLRSKGPLTVFAPTNDAFDALGKEVLSELLSDRDSLTELLLRHIIPGGSVGTLYTSGLCWSNLITATNELVRTGLGKEGVVLASPYSSASVVEADISATNGVVHISDSVL